MTVELQQSSKCVACALSSGSLDLPGGLIFATDCWLVEHCIGPLGVGTLIVKPIRHITSVADLTGQEAVELGALLQQTAAIVRDLTHASQVYVCLWSHGPAHIHFVVQPETAQAVAEFETFGPGLQAAMFAVGSVPAREQVEEFAERARRVFEANE